MVSGGSCRIYRTCLKLGMLCFVILGLRLSGSGCGEQEVAKLSWGHSVNIASKAYGLRFLLIGDDIFGGQLGRPSFNNLTWSLAPLNPKTRNLKTHRGA